MDQRKYQEELHAALAALAPVSDHATIAGDGAAMFLSVESLTRGIELYRHDDLVIIDRSVDGQLLGEQPFHSLEAALDAAKQWLGGKNE